MTPYAHAGQTLVTLILVSLAIWGWLKLAVWCAEKIAEEEEKREELLWAKAFVIAYQRVAKEEKRTADYESQAFALDPDFTSEPPRAA